MTLILNPFSFKQIGFLSQDECLWSNIVHLKSVFIQLIAYYHPWLNIVGSWYWATNDLDSNRWHSKHVIHTDMNNFGDFRIKIGTSSILVPTILQFELFFINMYCNFLQARCVLIRSSFSSTNMAEYG